MFEIFGNSHAALLTGAPPSGNKVSKQRQRPAGRGFTDVNPDYPFRTWFLGPILAYNFYEHHLHKIYEFMNDYPHYFNNNSYITLCVGEIDCRVHLPKYISNERSLENVVEECIDRYHRAIQDLVNNKKKVVIIGSLPSMSDDSIRRLMPLAEQKYNVAGTSEMRNKITRYWDQYHEFICRSNDIPFVSIYDSLVDECGKTKEDFFVDFIHLSYDKTIQLWIKEFEKKGLM